MTFARVRSLVVLGTLALLALVFLVVALVRDTQSGGAGSVAKCKEGYVLANIALHEPKDVKIRVFNGTDTPGRAAALADEFTNRDFKVVQTGNAKSAVEEVALLRYGPKAVGSAHLMRAYFLDEATPQYDAKRKDDVVDVVIGRNFKQLATTTEMKQSLVELGGRPELPAGTCAADEATS
ncbi:MAG TPA: LytR C-terminal domain-containing protein [Micromonosporaceae bacterium]|nr:LytR C-terminal domain-containing protein [Micromonosporaceae bacterium]